jgi:predicted O-linked N-acetylglucosamine transferase (SPINDLY family)
MRILAAVPDSALLLLAESGAAKLNLRRHAAASGIDPARLVFAGRVPYGDYIARYRAADLFLDTLPYNAGTTASDALWAGLPVLTCAGESLAGRMGASLLTAVGLPELIAWDREEYERLAVALARQPGLLAAVRGKLSMTHASAALFDTPRLTRNLETLYRRMYRRHRHGLLPEHLLLELPAVPGGV